MNRISLSKNVKRFFTTKSSAVILTSFLLVFTAVLSGGGVHAATPKKYDIDYCSDDKSNIANKMTYTAKNGVEYTTYRCANTRNDAEEIMKVEVREKADKDTTITAWPWFSVPGSSFFSMGGTFTFDDDNKVEVEFRGSFQGKGNINKQRVYSIRLGCNLSKSDCPSLHSNGTEIKGTNKKGIFTKIDGGSLYRGSGYSMASGKWMFYASGESLKGVIDLTKIPDFASKKKSAKHSKFTIDAPIISQLRVRYDNGSLRYDGSSYWTTIPITLQYVKWTLTPTTEINKTTASPKDTITWTHSVKSATGSTPTTVEASAEGGAKVKGTDTTYTGSWTIAKGFEAEKTSQKTSTYEVKSADVGKSICRGTKVSHYNQSTTSWTGWKDKKCVSIPYDYNLVPSVDIPGVGVIEPGAGAKIPITGNIYNDGSTKSKPNGNWQLSRIVFNKTPTPTQKEGGNHKDVACDWSRYNTGEKKKSCALVKSGTWPSSINSKSNFNNGIADEYLTEDHPVGTTVCYVLSIKPYSEGSTDWRHSKLQCITYGKKPKVQVWGGDAIAGRSINGSSMGYSGIDTSVSTKNPGGNTYGSWGEYALVANGQIRGMASGAGFNHPDGALSKQQSTWSNITFANTFKPSAPAGMKCTTKQRWGCYAYSIPDMPNLSAKFSVGTSMKAGDTSIGYLVKKTVYVMNGSGTINLSGSTLKKGEWVVINAKGATVNITSNINYTNASLANVSEIPQMVIIANNINIAPTVTNVDSWLIANNSLATCNERGNAGNLNTTSTAYNLSSGDCYKPLRVNGPVMTKKLWLRRTAGAGTGNQTGDPAEIFNYRPDAMLWLNSQFSSNALRTTNIKELPPRY